MLKKYMHQLPQDVVERLMSFLHHQWIICRDDKAEVQTGLGEESAITACQPKCQETHATRLTERLQHVGATTIRRKAHGDILPARQNGKPARELRAVGCPAGMIRVWAAEHGAIVGECKGRQCAFADNHRVDKLHGNMLGVCGCGAISEG